MGFRYDEAPTRLAMGEQVEGTKVAGHPVLLSLLIGDGRDSVDGIVIETDPTARLYLRKKAFLFGDQVKARYGDQGWTCRRRARGDEEPVGGVFLKEHCEKTATRPARA